MNVRECINFLLLFLLILLPYLIANYAFDTCVRIAFIQDHYISTALQYV